MSSESGPLEAPANSSAEPSCSIATACVVCLQKKLLAVLILFVLGRRFENMVELPEDFIFL
jgi:hypothetical protein